MIDYIITNKYLQPFPKLDIRTLNSANIGSDHKLLLGKIKMKLKTNRNTGRKNKRRMIVGIIPKENKLLDEKDDINKSWEKLKRNIN